jgi:hypothetical protein
MKPSWWEFRAETGWLMIRTPWFGIFWSEYSADPLNDWFWRGVTLFWKRNRDIREGECYYMREFTLRTDIVSGAYRSSER